MMSSAAGAGAGAGAGVGVGFGARPGYGDPAYYAAPPPNPPLSRAGCPEFSSHSTYNKIKCCGTNQNTNDAPNNQA